MMERDPCGAYAVRERMVKASMRNSVALLSKHHSILDHSPSHTVNDSSGHVNHLPQQRFGVWSRTWPCSNARWFHRAQMQLTCSIFNASIPSPSNNHVLGMPIKATLGIHSSQVYRFEQRIARSCSYGFVQETQIRISCIEKHHVWVTIWLNEEKHRRHSKHGTSSKAACMHVCVLLRHNGW